ncbi:LLM class flavin-dependent oxidoreductase [Nonomuraea africana]|uniref:Alkanesulfonate monooxygenase SsuD/methylene tetrahydromethanopterin reductase-like flavin-dependent oxidoreductase (Luciferase family) n=1 Tax=Nonomuraea africana TaxID=46171 RepID=A0ABR9K7X3_9ACTN|nr:LLM class flavin-dependent oxidoreductase [Nonomuraea africana]MBE1557906.1 alkanesulfonate monooxygenase SsuD/methylene tetrahydromethanopterin reductase-like flavin-dependent oxidoreductase (luciferase family) [Nonomuraea africana]
MTTRPFRFGVVAGHANNGQDWTALARRAERLGYATLLTPDTLSTFSPFPALAAAAAVTTTLRLGTYVLSAPNRTPGQVAWEANALRILSGGRFELGLGAGRPGAEADSSRLGFAHGTPSERVSRLAATVDAVADVPILIAAAGPRLLRLAAEKADIIALALPVQATEDQLAARLDELYELAGDRFPQLEINANVAAIGDDLPPWLLRQLGGEPSGTGILTGSVEEMAETLSKRRDRLGISYVSINADYMEAFAPVVRRLAGT